MDTPEFRAKVLEAEVRAVKEYVSTLSLEDLEKASACEGWTVADVVGHLAGQPFVSRMNRGLQGDISPDGGASAVATHDEDRFARNIFDRAKSTNEQYGERLLEILCQHLGEDVGFFNDAKPGDWDKLCYWPPGPEPVRTMLDMRISELTMHIWDIRSVLHDQYHLSNDSVMVLIDTVDRAARRAFRPDPSLANPVRHRFVIAGPISTGRDIVVAAEGARVEPAGSDAPDVTFRCDGETYVLVMYGRLKAETAMADGRLTFEGNAQLASGFGQRFVGG
jgi:uncharacterized protein (TIGR03083 family)